MDLLECLYQYAVDNRINSYLVNEKEYMEEVEYRDINLKWLRAHLDGDALNHLDSYQGSVDGQIFYEYRTLFQAGLALGLELGCL